MFIVTKVVKGRMETMSEVVCTIKKNTRNMKRNFKNEKQNHLKQISKGLIRKHIRQLEARSENLKFNEHRLTNKIRG